MQNSGQLVHMGEHLFNVELQHGKKLPREYHYLVDGKKLTFKEIRALVPAGVVDSTIRYRLNYRYSCTLEYLSEKSLKGSTGKANAHKKHLAARRGREKAEARREFYAKRKAAHADVD